MRFVVDRAQPLDLIAQQGDFFIRSFRQRFDHLKRIQQADCLIEPIERELRPNNGFGFFGLADRCGLERIGCPFAQIIDFVQVLGYIQFSKIKALLRFQQSSLGLAFVVIYYTDF